MQASCKIRQFEFGKAIRVVQNKPRKVPTVSFQKLLKILEKQNYFCLFPDEFQLLLSLDPIRDKNAILRLRQELVDCGFRRIFGKN